MKYRILFFCSVLIIAGCGKDKTKIHEPVQVKKTDYKIIVDSMPMPAGGMAEIQKNVIYPEKARDNGISGKVYVQAYVNEKGDIDRIDVMKSSDTMLNKAAINAVKKTKFFPGKVGGENVKTQVVIPIVFKLQDSEKIDITSSDSINKSLAKFNPEYFVVAEVMPKIKGGINELMKKIVYPAAAKEKGIEGKVHILTLIDEQGNVVSATPMKEENPLLIHAAIDAIKKTEFIPGRQKDKTVKVQIVIPVMFKLK